MHTQQVLQRQFAAHYSFRFSSKPKSHARIDSVLVEINSLGQLFSYVHISRDVLNAELGPANARNNHEKSCRVLNRNVGCVCSTQSRKALQCLESESVAATTGIQRHPKYL